MVVFVLDGVGHFPSLLALTEDAPNGVHLVMMGFLRRPRNLTSKSRIDQQRPRSSPVTEGARERFSKPYPWGDIQEERLFHHPVPNMK